MNRQLIAHELMRIASEMVDLEGMSMKEYLEYLRRELDGSKIGGAHAVSATPSADGGLDIHVTVSNPKLDQTRKDSFSTLPDEAALKKYMNSPVILKIHVSQDGKVSTVMDAYIPNWFGSNGDLYCYSEPSPETFHLHKDENSELFPQHRQYARLISGHASKEQLSNLISKNLECMVPKIIHTCTFRVRKSWLKDSRGDLYVHCSHEFY